MQRVHTQGTQCPNEHFRLLIAPYVKMNCKENFENILDNLVGVSKRGFLKEDWTRWAKTQKERGDNCVLGQKCGFLSFYNPSINIY